MTYFDGFEYFVMFSFIMDSDAVRARADTVDLVARSALYFRDTPSKTRKKCPCVRADYNHFLGVANGAVDILSVK